MHKHLLRGNPLRKRTKSVKEDALVRGVLVDDVECACALRNDVGEIDLSDGDEPALDRPRGRRFRAVRARGFLRHQRGTFLTARSADNILHTAQVSARRALCRLVNGLRGHRGRCVSVRYGRRGRCGGHP